MQLDEQIQHHIDLLPLELKAEVLDFVLFLNQKRERQAKEHINNLMSIIPDELVSEKRQETENEDSNLTKVLKDGEFN